MKAKIKAIIVLASLVILFVLPIISTSLSTPFAFGSVPDTEETQTNNQDFSNYPSTLMQEMNAIQVSYRQSAYSQDLELTSSSNNAIFGALTDTIYVTVGTVVLAVALVAFAMIIRKRPK